MATFYVDERAGDDFGLVRLSEIGKTTIEVLKHNLCMELFEDYAARHDKHARDDYPDPAEGDAESDEDAR